HYGIEYEINAWMSRERPANAAVAREQWAQLKQVLEEAGARTEIVEPVAGLPDMVFTANAGLVHGNRMILAHFRHVERQGEEKHFRRWFEQAGFQVEHPPQ